MKTAAIITGGMEQGLGPCASSCATERLLWRRHPISRHWLLPVTLWVVERFAATNLQPWHITICGFACATIAAAAIGTQAVGWLSAGFVMLMWWCDRLDGALARRKQSATPLGGWLDANLDEAADVMIHAAIAFAAAEQFEASWPWMMFAALVAGKYLFFHGVSSEREICVATSPSDETKSLGVVRTLYHGVGDADIRVHVLAVALLAGGAVGELILYAAYYNVRWLARFPLVIRQLAQGRTE